MKNKEALNESLLDKHCTSKFDCDHSWVTSCDECSYLKAYKRRKISSIDELKSFINKEIGIVVECLNDYAVTTCFINENGDICNKMNEVYCNISELKLGVDEDVYEQLDN